MHRRRRRRRRHGRGDRRGARAAPRSPCSSACPASARSCWPPATGAATSRTRTSTRGASTARTPASPARRWRRSTSRRHSPSSAGLGIEPREEEAGKIFPRSGQASAVLDVLRHELAHLGVETRCEAEVTRLAPRRGGVGGRHARRDAAGAAPSCSPAAGGRRRSSARTAAATSWSRPLGHRLIRRFPALTRIRVASPFLKHLKGVKIEGVASLVPQAGSAPRRAPAPRPGERRRRRDPLHRDRPLRPADPRPEPPRRRAGAARRADPRACSISARKSRRATWRRCCAALLRAAPDVSAELALVGFLHKRLIAPVLEVAGIPDPTRPAASLGEPRGPRRRRGAQGLATSRSPAPTPGPTRRSPPAASTSRSVDPATLESRLAPGLFFAGEVLDIDGDCGGFNLQWAWSSGHLAGPGGGARSNPPSAARGRADDSRLRGPAPARPRRGGRCASALLERLGIPPEELLAWRVARRSVDARKKDRVQLVYLLDAEVADPAAAARARRGREARARARVPLRAAAARGRAARRAAGRRRQRPRRALRRAAARRGRLPAARARARPAGRASARSTSRALLERGAFDPESNVVFGEGGAGPSPTASSTRSSATSAATRSSPSSRPAAPPAEILVSAKPHIGTDHLRRVVPALRARIVAAGGEVRFGARVDDLARRGGPGARGVAVDGEARSPPAPSSSPPGTARATPSPAATRAASALAPKPFSLGVRVEHPQAAIDRAQHGRAAGTRAWRRGVQARARTAPRAARSTPSACAPAARWWRRPPSPTAS